VAHVGDVSVGGQIFSGFAQATPRLPYRIWTVVTDNGFFTSDQMDGNRSNIADREFPEHCMSAVSADDKQRIRCGYETKMIAKMSNTCIYVTVTPGEWPPRGCLPRADSSVVGLFLSLRPATSWLGFQSTMKCCPLRIINSFGVANRPFVQTADRQFS
jgi:hypothetical protein